MRYLFALGLFAIFLSSCTTRYYLVRHAEKQIDGTENPPLSAEGLERARALADSLLNKSVDRIYTTQYLRTQQTAKPLADTLGLAPEIISSGDIHGLVEELRRFKGNNTLLIVGHSNTIPIFIDSLMQRPQHVVIPENDYDNLYLVKVSRGTSVVRNLIPGTFGEPSP